MLKDTISKLKAIRSEVGYSEYDQAVKIIARERLQNDSRDKRKTNFKWSDYVRHYKRQKGICPWCKQPMALIKGQLAMDHIDPNRQDFNDDSNLQVNHPRCNRSKGSMSVADQAKRNGTTYREILSGDEEV